MYLCICVFVYLCICVFMYLCICVFVYLYFLFACLTHGNVIFDILEQSSFQKYATCWVFLALDHMLYFCMCVFVFLYLHVWHMGIWFLLALHNPLFKNIPHVGSFWHFVICCICVFVYLYFFCMFDTWKCHFWYPWTILFLKICHMLGVSGTLSYARFVYLCICVFVFVYLCMRHLVISVLISVDQELSENVWFVWSKTS